MLKCGDPVFIDPLKCKWDDRFRRQRGYFFEVNKQGNAVVYLYAYERGMEIAPELLTRSEYSDRRSWEAKWEDSI